MQKPGQYIPFSMRIDSVDLIVYPVKDKNPLKDLYDNEDDIKSHLRILYSRNDLNVGTYHIVFAWNLKAKRMVDVWIHTMENWVEGCGPLVEVRTFCEYRKTRSFGVASGDTLMVLGREEELRRQTSSLQKYLNRRKIIPDFISGFKPNEKFE